MNLVDPATLKKFLARHGVVAAKGLGQHFLCSRPVVDSIVQSLEGTAGLLEIGPGPGVLTAPLSERAKLIAFEVDPRMIAALAESAPHAEVRQADALKESLVDALSQLPEPRGVVSNLPYYITGPLLTRIAEASAYWSCAVLMMQREVANKVVAKVGDRDRGSLSVYLQSQFEIRIVSQVPAGAFLPPPKVDSTVLSLTPRGVAFSDTFYRVVRMSFGQPRKTLANNLVAGLHRSREEILSLLEAAGIDERERPQMLTVDQWVALADLVERKER